MQCESRVETLRERAPFPASPWDGERISYRSVPGSLRFVLRDLMQFDAVGLSQIGTVASANRIDTKFVLPLNQVSETLEFLRNSYSILEVGTVRLHSYRTLYFDTRAFDLYFLHHRKSRRSFKVRSRHYVDSGRSFLEVKRKSRPNRSVKLRTETPRLVTALNGRASEFVQAHAPVDPARLGSALWTGFRRISLVSKSSPERVTLDLGLQFRQAGSQVDLPGVAVAELKQERLDRASELYRCMRGLGVRPTGFSKYCVGVSLLNPGVKHNRIKPKLRMVRMLAARGHRAG